MINKIKKELIKRNISLYELALDMHLSESSLRMYINGGKLGIKALSKIQKYYKTERNTN